MPRLRKAVYVGRNTMEHPNITDFLDRRNENLWKDLISQFNITLAISPDDTYICYTKNNNVIIYVPINSICKDSFTHELLHVYLKHKQVDVGACLSTYFRIDDLLSNIYDEGLVEHVGNCLDHYKMLPLYLDLGFDRQKFISDYADPKCNQSQVLLLKTCIETSQELWLKVAPAFMSAYFAMKACPNPTFNYDDLLSDLMTLDKNLFNIYERFWNSWKLFDIEKFDSVFNNYRQMCEQFTTELKDWSSSKL